MRTHSDDVIRVIHIRVDKMWLSIKLTNMHVYVSMQTAYHFVHQHFCQNLTAIVCKS